MNAVIVSAADAGFFPLLKGLIQSIHRHRPNRDVAIGVLDVGLEAAQIAELRELEARVVPGEWDIEFPGRDATPRWYQAMTARCHLPKYFPEYELLIWIDADAWLQDWRAIELLIAAAGKGELVVVPEVHRSYRHLYHLADINHDNLYKVYRHSFPEDQSRFLAASPLLNSGVIALRRDSETWQVWAKWLAAALCTEGTRPHKMSEQSALNAAFYFGKIRIYPLPAWCNWVCGQALPAYDSENRRFVEPILPFEAISILHATPRRTAPRIVPTVDGKMLSLPLDYLPYQAAIAELANQV